MTSQAEDKCTVSPEMYLELIQIGAPKKVIEQALSGLTSECAALRAATAASIASYDLPFLREPDLQRATAGFSRAADLTGLSPLHRNAAKWMAELLARETQDIDPAGTGKMFFRRVEQIPAADTRVLLLCAADPAYFFVFSELYLNSVIEFSGQFTGVHFVLVNFSDSQLVRARAIFRKYETRLSLSFSTMKLEPGVHRSFYCIARFYELVNLWKLIDRTRIRKIVVTDIDHVFIRPLTALLNISSSVAVAYVTAAYLFPWLRFRANLLLLNPSCERPQDVEAAFSVLAKNLAIVSSSRQFWFLDQACIALMLQKLIDVSGRVSCIRDITNLYSAASLQPTGNAFDP
jgi:hypothetical protein